MSKKIKDLAVANGKYNDRDGVEKTKWLNVGAIIQKDDGGTFMLIDRTFNPAGVANPENRSTLIISMFDVKKKESNNDSGSVDTAGKGDSPFSDDNIPF